ncbi:hypothetical protein [Paenibacillus sp. 1001270B_150601_E10]|uniref:hypothetical protein n=1 Tax=Paenibacillus sp. 1001270B_150601_E10 TaxID=2787079 RepID=UPI002B4C11FB|nr:hypothetical protein [Paenibacillus sp. 1001270B_150601_E10]
MPLYHDIKHLSFQQFLEDPDWEGLNNNPQARMLNLTQTFGDDAVDPSIGWAPGSTFRNPYLVKQFLRGQFRFIGVTEHMPESFKMLGRLFHWPIPTTIPHENKIPRRIQREQLSSDVIALIRYRCSLDMKLYEYALQMFQERMGSR